MSAAQQSPCPLTSSATVSLSPHQQRNSLPVPSPAAQQSPCALTSSATVSLSPHQQRNSLPVSSPAAQQSPCPLTSSATVSLSPHQQRNSLPVGLHELRRPHQLQRDESLSRQQLQVVIVRQAPTTDLAPHGTLGHGSVTTSGTGSR